MFFADFKFFLVFLQPLKYLLSVCEYKGEAERK